MTGPGGRVIELIKVFSPNREHREEFAAARTRPDQIIYFMNNIGLGLQFAIAGAKLYELARDAGLGRECPTEWFTQDVHS